MVDRSTALGMLIAIPFLASLAMAELVASRMLKRRYYTSALDAAASFTSGMWNLTVTGAGLIFTFVSYEWLEAKLAVTDLGSSPLSWALTFLTLDIGFYGLHRAAHRFNVLWQTHLVHHTPEEINIASALRNGGTPISIRFVILVPLAVLGVEPKLVLLMSGVQLIATNWYHTCFFGELGPLGKVIVTPAQHRVHHAINEAYIDKNFGALLSIWDHMFGTYQPELDDVPPVYGLTRPLRTYNPLRMDYAHWWQMIKDTVRAGSVRDKVWIWLAHTNWRPSEVASEHPVAELKTEAQRRAYERYRPEADLLATAWSTAEVVLQGVLTMELFWWVSQGFLDRPAMIVFAGMLLLSIVTYSTALDGRPHTILTVCRFGVAALLVIGVSSVGWFSLPTDGLFALTAAVVLPFYAAAIVMSGVAKRSPAPPLDVTAMAVA